MTGYVLSANVEEAQLYREPDWMPSPEDVARARTQMERDGITRALVNEPVGRSLVPVGEAPTMWLLAAAAWIVVWPAAIVFRLLHGLGAGIVPWWLPVVLAGLHMLALAGPVLLAERDSGRNALRKRFGRVQTVAQMLALQPEEFEAWIGMLFTLSGYEVQDTQQVGDHGIDVAVSGPGVRRGLVQCKRYRGTVGEPVVRDLYGTMMHEGADYGWLATTGALSRQAHEWSAGKPMDLWDGQKLVELARKYR